MQSLELSCQEKDFMLNDTLNKIKNHHASSSASATAATNARLSSVTQHQNCLQNLNNIQNAQNVQNILSNESNSTMTTNSSSTATITSQSRANHNSTDRFSITKSNQTSTQVPSSTAIHDGGGGFTDTLSHTKLSTDSHGKQRTSSNSSVSESTSNSSYFDIHEKLRELYVYLYLKDIQDTQVDNRIKLKSRSFVLETLVARENLNTVILNLYPGNKGYSLAFRYPAQNRKHDGSQSIFRNTATSATTMTTTPSPTATSTKAQLCGATDGISQNCISQERGEQLLETVRWPYEINDLLESINNEELPILYMKLFLSYAPNAFYSGCVIVEVRDYRQSFPLSTCCDNYYVLLKPTTQTLLADIKVLSNDEEFTYEDRVSLESNMILATADPLCLDPSPKVARKALYSQYKRQMWNNVAIRRRMRKFSQVAINRKRKTDQFSPAHGLELSDYLFRSRQRHFLPTQSSFDSTNPLRNKRRDPNEIWKPIRTPVLDLPATLEIPSTMDVEKSAIVYPSPEESREYQLNFIEQYTLETDRGKERIYLISLTIYQRKANLEYMGTLYVDRDYKSGPEKTGEACHFALGTRAQANRYIRQFTEIFTEEGRKSVKITHEVPGKEPVIVYSTGVGDDLSTLLELTKMRSSRSSVSNQPITTQHRNQQQQSAVTKTATSAIVGIATSSQSPTNAQKSTAKFINTTFNTNTQQFATAIKIPATTSTTQMSPSNRESAGPSQQQPQQQTTHLNIANGSLFLVRDQSSGNITGIATKPLQQQSQSKQQQGMSTGTATATVVSTGTANANSLPILQAQLQVTQQINKPQTVITTQGNTTDVNSMLPTNLIQSPPHSFQLHTGSSTSKSNNNAAIISLLNSAPAAMTSSTVVNNLNTSSNSQVQLSTLVPAPSPSSDSNASSASSTNLGNFQMTPGFPFLGSTSPTTSIASSDCSSGPISDKSFVEVSMRGQSPHSAGSPTIHFMTASPKNNPVPSISPLSSPPPQTETIATNSAPTIHVTRKQSITSMDTASSNQSANQQSQTATAGQTTTLNLHGINLSSLQGAMATFPQLQNVQVQIPGYSQPISLSLAGATGATIAANSHPLFVSVPASSASQVNQLPVGKTLIIDNGQQGQGQMLSLPIAQLVAASNVKNLNPQQIRSASIAGVNVNLAATQQQQNQTQQPNAFIQQQRPRLPTIATTTINAKQLTARGLITTQRNINVAPNTAQQMKITTPITMASVNHATVSNLNAVNNNPMLLQIQLQKQHQQLHPQNQQQ